MDSTTARLLFLPLSIGLAAASAAPARLLTKSAPSPAAQTQTVSEQQAAQDDGVVLDGLGHDRGTAMARNWVAEFLDFGCGYCAKFAFESYPTLEKEFVSSGRIRWKIVPFVSGQFPNSEEAAVAAECAGEQGKFLPMHDSLLAARKEWMKSSAPQGVFARIGGRIGLKPTLLAVCTAGDRARTRVRKQTMVARRVNIRGTPTVFINGERIEGAIPLPLFRQVLQQALK